MTFHSKYPLFILLIGFLSFHCSISIADTLTITVFQKGTGDPVEDATVVIKNNGDYDSTNHSGEIKFEDITLPVEIKVLSSGYETIEQKVETNKLEIYLEPLTIEGEGIEVVEERIKEKASKIVLQQEELRSVAGTQGDPIKMIETLPGVITNSGGGGDGGGDPNAIYVRGSSGGENSFWINRYPVDYLYHFWGISVVNPSLVNNFNIFLGGFPVEYDDVLGGVIDIELRKPKTDRLHQTYRIALNESAALVEGPINKNQSFYVAARASYIDKVLDPFIDDIQEALKDEESETDVSVITLPKYWDAQANWHYNLSKGSMDLFYFGSNDALAFDIKQLDTSDPDILGKLDVDFGFHTFGFNLRTALTKKTTAIVTTSIKRGHQLTTFGTDDNGEPFGIDITITQSLLHPQLLFNPIKNHEFTVGSHINYGVYPVDVNISSFPTEENFTGRNFSSQEKFRVNDTMKLASASPYLKWRWTWEKLTTILGGRYTKVRGTGGIDMMDYSPRVTFEYQLTKKLLATTSWGRYIQTPNEAQLLKGYGNPELEFTVAEHRIIGMQYQYNPLWSIKMEAYQKPMKNLVLTRPFEQPPNNYKNDGEGEAYGFDVLIKREYGNRKIGWLSYSYSKSSRTLIDGSNRDFSADQPHALSLVWSQPFTGSWKKWSWGLKLQAGSGQPYTPVVGRVAMCNTAADVDVCPDQENADDDSNLAYWNPIYAERNILRRPFFHKLDLRVDRLIRYNTWTLKLYLDLLNVTMQEFGVSDDYGKNYENYNNPKKSGFPAIILPFFGVEASF